ncbi:MAG: ABC-F family ATP-binding cassette domain-containing protein [Microbacteriaceae bacterium]
MAHLLGAQDISLAYPNRVLLDSLTLGISDGDRIGVVGRNGDGKSTLLQILAGSRNPDSGRVTMRSGLSVGTLSQTDDFEPNQTVAQAILGDRPEYEWAQDSRIRDVLAGLVPELAGDALVSDLSGGQRRRVALARLLVEDNEVIFLDEPTNHLDLAGVNWLAQHLNRRWSRNSGALIVVTHDRWFLDEVTTQTWEVHDGIVDAYEGGYAAYILQRVERQRQSNVMETKRQNLLRKELAWLRRGAPARTAKPKFRIDAANALIADIPPLRDQIELKKLSTARQGKDVVELVAAGFSYPEREILKATDWLLGPGDRIGLLGHNGAGKSTLLKLISAELTPTIGRIKRGKTLKLAVLSQQLDELKGFQDNRVTEVLAQFKTSYKSGDKELSPAQLLESLGFGSNQLSNRVKDLSGGQKRRLQILLVLMSEPNLLILDEPTNDLDTDMLAALEDLLDSWPGTLIVVSHDRYLLERVTDDQFALIDGRMRHLPKGVDQYLQLISKEASTGSKILDETSSPENSWDSGAEAAVNTALQGTLGAPEASLAKPLTPSLGGAERRNLEKESAAITRKISKLDELLQVKKVSLAAHDQGDYIGLNALSEGMVAIESEIEQLEERWLEITEALS